MEKEKVNRALPSDMPNFEDEWYEDSIDMNMRAFSMTEDEWMERERGELQADSEV